MIFIVFAGSQCILLDDDVMLGLQLLQLCMTARAVLKAGHAGSRDRLASGMQELLQEPRCKARGRASVFRPPTTSCCFVAAVS